MSAPSYDDDDDDVSGYKRITIQPSLDLGSNTKSAVSSSMTSSNSIFDYTVCMYIIVNELCERLAYYGFTGSLVLFFTRELHYSTADADFHINIWQGMCYITPLLGGYLADAHFGRYNTIMLFIIVYLMGMILASVTAMTSPVSDTQFFIALYIVALGTGGIKSNVSTLGADQLEGNAALGVPAASDAVKSSFFMLFYGSINVGAFISYTLVAALCQNVSFGVGYSIPSLAMMGAVIAFWWGRNKYVRLPPTGSMVGIFVGILWESLRRRSHYQRIVNPTHEASNGGTSTPPHQPSVSIVQGYDDSGIQESNGSSTNKYDRLAAHTNASTTDDIGVSAHSMALHHWTDAALRRYGGSYTERQVQDIRYVLDLVPFVFLFIVYWACYNSMNTTFYNQGCAMDLSLGSYTIPIAAINLFDTLIIMILIPTFDSWLFPLLERRGVRLTTLRKIGVGFVIASCSMLMAACLEFYRLTVAAEGRFIAPTPCASGTGPDVPQAVAVSIGYQIPQYLLMGASEVLASAVSTEFFYTQAPASMKSVCSALSLLTTALGAWLCALLVPIVNLNPAAPWIAHDANQGHLDYFFALLAVLMALNTALFIYYAKRYQYKVIEATAPTTALTDVAPNNDKQLAGG